VNQEVCNIDLKTQGEREGGPEINSKIWLKFKFAARLL
jgi:hypothetical protein